MNAELFITQMRRISELSRAGRAQEAWAAMQQAADGGNPDAAYFVAGKALIGEGTSRDPERAVRLLRTAAAAGHREAVHLLAILHAAGEGCARDWPQALALLSDAAEKSHALARAQIALLGAEIDAQYWLKPPPARMAFDAPRVGVIENFITPEICAWLIDRARSQLGPALVGDAETGAARQSAGRTNTTAYFPMRQADVVFQLVRARIAAAMKTPVSHQEVPSVLHYHVGEEFEPHFDFLFPDTPSHAQQIARFGQRAATFLIYLSEDFDGGETAFPDLNWSFKGRTGDAVFFWNVSPAGAVEERLVHAGTPTTRGEKWLFSQWIRDRPILSA